jgi:DNA-binding FrmR family transcriptional regulator
MKDEKLTSALLSRIRKTRGQIEGVERMISADKYCIDIINQIHAARRALDAITLILIENHVSTCVKEGLTQKGKSKNLIEELTRTLNQYLKK